MNGVGRLEASSGAAQPRAESAAPERRAALDDTDAYPDSLRSAPAAVLAAQSQQQLLQLRLDRMKADFNAAQEERSELLRESNALRDMALEQAKKDDEVLKKYIAMI